jgi:DNA-directed RNA polymerase specialized sigma24 family protein
MSRNLAEAALRDYSKPLHRYLLRRLTSPHSAEDIAQETYLRLCGVDDGALIRAPQAYVFRIASNLVYELRLREQREAVTFNSELANHAAEQGCGLTEDAVATSLDTTRLLAVLLASLPPLYTAILILKKRDGKRWRKLRGNSGFQFTRSKNIYAGPWQQSGPQSKFEKP